MSQSVNGSDEVMDEKKEKGQENPFSMVGLAGVLRTAQNQTDFYERLILQLVEDKKVLNRRIDEKREHEKLLEERIVLLESDASNDKLELERANREMQHLRDEIDHLKEQLGQANDEIEKLKHSRVPKQSRSAYEKQLEQAVQHEKEELEKKRSELKKVHKEVDKKVGQLGRMEAVERIRKKNEKH